MKERFRTKQSIPHPITFSQNMQSVYTHVHVHAYVCTFQKILCTRIRMSFSRAVSERVLVHALVYFNSMLNTRMRMIFSRAVSERVLVHALVYFYSMLNTRMRMNFSRAVSERVLVYTHTFTECCVHARG